MTKSIYKSVFSFVLMAGILLTSVAPSVFAQGNSNCRTRNRNAQYVNYDDRDYDSQRDRASRRNRDYGYENDPNYDRSSRRSRDYGYENDSAYDRNRSRNDGLKRTGIGAAIGAGGGALMGGRKGALIGGAAGAVGGYLYHRNKEKNRRY